MTQKLTPSPETLRLQAMWQSSTPGFPYPAALCPVSPSQKSLLPCQHASPGTINFPILHKSPLSDPARSPPFCNRWWLWWDFLTATDALNIQVLMDNLVHWLTQPSGLNRYFLFSFVSPNSDNWPECLDLIRHKWKKKDHWKSKRVPEKHLLLLYGLRQSHWLYGSQQTVENSSRGGNTRAPDLPLEKSVWRSGRNS